MLGCSQFKFGTNPPVTMMAMIMREGEEKMEMATYRKEENSLTEYIPELKAMKIAVDIPSDLMEVKDIRSSSVVKINKERSEELIAFVTNTTELASKDESKPTERSYMWGYIPFHRL